MAKHSCALLKGIIYVVGREKDSYISAVYDPVWDIWSAGPRFINNHRTYTGSMTEFQGSLYFREYYSENGQGIYRLEDSNSWNLIIKIRTKDDIFPIKKNFIWSVLL